MLAEGPFKELELGYVYLKKMTDQKEFFRALDKHLVPAKILQNFISNTAKSDSSEHVKKKFIEYLRWYLKVRIWIYSVHLFMLNESK